VIEFTNLDTILLGTYSLAFVVQLIYLWFFFGRLAFYKPKIDKTIEKPVSVVITARDEYHNLKRNLPSILNQNYPDFEVVVVIHKGDEETIELMADLSKEYLHLKVVNMAHSVSFYPGKKFPLSIGIKSAKNDILLLTDADCAVNSANWIRNMQQGFENHTQIVLGYGPYKPNRTLLNYLIRYYSFFTALNYLSFALAKIPYMGVGRNLAYRKSLFYKNNGFISHYKVASGDDDLFVNETANKKNVKICIQPDSFTYSTPKTTLKHWLRQKRRHLSAGRLYKKKHQFLLGLYPFSLSGFYALSAYLIYKDICTIFVIGLLTLRIISFLIIQKASMNKLREKKLFFFSPVLELLLFLLNSWLVITNMLYDQNRWK
jgi:biofilm PGA synthesis N-glycosyltransferase PgaC